MCASLHTLHLGVKCLAQAVGQQVEAEHQQAHDHDGRDDLIGMGGEAVVQLTDQGTQRALRHRDAQTHEGKECLGKDRGGDAEHDLSDDGSDDVGQHFLKDDKEAAGTQSAGSQNEFLVLQLEHLGAGDAAHAHPLGQHQGEDDGDHAGLQHQKQQRDDDQTGDAVGNFKKALHQHIHLAAEVARDEAIAHADDHINDGSRHGDDQGDAGTFPGTGPDVAAIEVAAEPVVDVILAFFDIVVDDFRTGGRAHLLAAVQNAELLDAGDARREVLLAQILTGISISIHSRAKDGQQQDDHDHHEAQHGALLAEEADADVFPEALGREVGIHRDLSRVVLPGKLCLGELVLRVQFLHGLRDGCGGAFAAQSDRFFCHISRPPLPDGCAGR